MLSKFTTIALLGLTTLVSAHMELQFPPPLDSKFNPATPEANIDYSMTSPLNADGSNYPCKGYNTASNIASTPPVATLNAGQDFNITLAGSATHNGGSCQFAISYDQGTTFAVVASIIGGCPLTPEYNFKLPASLPSADKALFAWTWENHSGNREMYMNCAVVSVAGSGSAYTGPALFRANTFAGGDCTTIEGQDPVYPNPGPVVQYGGGLSSSSPPTTLSPCSYDQNANVKVGPSGSSGAGSGSAAPVASSATATATASSSTTATASVKLAKSSSSQIALPSDFSSGSASASTTTAIVTTTTAPLAASATAPSASSIASSGGSTSTVSGATIKCLSASTFALCDGDNCTNMGNVAAGTQCVGGVISATRMKRAGRHGMKKRLAH